MHAWTEKASTVHHDETRRTRVGHCPLPRPAHAESLLLTHPPPSVRRADADADADADAAAMMMVPPPDRTSSSLPTRRSDKEEAGRAPRLGEHPSWGLGMGNVQKCCRHPLLIPPGALHQKSAILFFTPYVTVVNWTTSAWVIVGLGSVGRHDAAHMRACSSLRRRLGARPW
jgi:hypothetical protein